MPPLEIRQIPVLADNYVYLARDPATEACAAIDPAVAEPVLAELARLGWRLTMILNTHHHGDHVGGNLALQAATGCVIVGNRADARRIPGIDRPVGDGETVAIGTQTARVLAVDGHTIGHVAYHFAESGALFCGDTLFSLGCGRLFEGTPSMMWDSLCRLRALPDATRVYCAHEYTEGNARFALSVDLDNAALRRRAVEVRERRLAGWPTVPSRLGEERATNPFLRADEPALRDAIGLPDADAVTTFAALRRRKDSF